MAVRLAIAAASTFEGEAGGLVSTPLGAPRMHYRRGASIRRACASTLISNSHSHQDSHAVSADQTIHS
jgi:hypothetical protein